MKDEAGVEVFFFENEYESEIPNREAAMTYQENI